MHKKKYLLLIVPAVLLSALGFTFLPTEIKSYSFLLPILAWIAYYFWIYFEKKNQNK